jgi:Tol biopolymer transport system component
MIDMYSTWSPDGREIYFCSTRTGMHIWKVTVADGVVRAVTNPGGMSMEALPNARWPLSNAAMR